MSNTPSSAPCMGGPLDRKMTSNVVDFVHEDGTRYMYLDIRADANYRIFYAADTISTWDVFPRLLSAYMQDL